MVKEATPELMVQAWLKLRVFHQPLICRDGYLLNPIHSYINCLENRHDPMSQLTWKDNSSPDLHFLLTTEEP